MLYKLLRLHCSDKKNWGKKKKNIEKGKKKIETIPKTSASNRQSSSKLL